MNYDGTGGQGLPRAKHGTRSHSRNYGTLVIRPDGRVGYGAMTACGVYVHESRVADAPSCPRCRRLLVDKSLAALNDRAR